MQIQPHGPWTAESLSLRFLVLSVPVTFFLPSSELIFFSAHIFRYLAGRRRVLVCVQLCLIKPYPHRFLP